MNWAVLTNKFFSARCGNCAHWKTLPQLKVCVVIDPYFKENNHDNAKKEPQIRNYIICLVPNQSLLGRKCKVLACIIL